MTEVLTLEAAGIARDARRVNVLAVEAMRGRLYGARDVWEFTIGSSGAVSYSSSLGYMFRRCAEYKKITNGRVNGREEEGG